MSLILCPECQRKISDRATNCPGCGFPLHSSEDPPTVISAPSLETTCAETVTIPAGFTVPEKIRNPLRSLVNVVLFFAIIAVIRSGGAEGSFALIALPSCVAFFLARIDSRRNRRAWEPVTRYRTEIMEEFGDQIKTPNQLQLAMCLQSLAKEPNWDSTLRRKNVVEQLTILFPKLRKD